MKKATTTPVPTSEPILYRTAELTRAEGEGEESRSFDLVFATETPVERWFGLEILNCSPGSVRMERIRSGAPLLLNHDPTRQIGVVEKAKMEGKVGRARVRFGKSPLAEEILNDVRDGIRRLVSVGYRVHEMVLVKAKGEGGDTYRADDWEPHEISVVPIPADLNAGIGRSLAEFCGRITTEAEAANPAEGESEAMKRRLNIQREPDNGGEPQGGAAPITVTEPQNRAASVTAPAPYDRSKEAYRIREIGALGVKFGMTTEAEAAIRDGSDLSDFQRKVIESRFNAKPIDLTKPAIDIPARDAQRYSLVRAINIAASGRPIDGIEGEVHQEFAKTTGRQASGFWLPTNIPLGPQPQRRDLIAGTAEYGGNTVATELLSGSFIDLLTNTMLTKALGMTTLNGLRGNIAIPRASGGATAYWVSEVGAASESTPTFDQVPMSPKGVSAWVEYGKQLLAQSSIGVEAFVRNEIARRLSLAVDLAAIDGAGSSNEPTGILRTSGIGSYALGTDGAAPTWAMIVGLETDCAVSNAPWQNMAYLTNPLVRGILKQTPKQSSGVEGNFIWSDQAFPGQPQYGTVNGYKAAATNQVPSNKTKNAGSSLSCMIFGNWAELVMGQWDGIDVVVDPYTRAKEAIILIVARMWVDVAVQHPAAFSACQDIVAA